jgi:uncharacterized protein (DUF302 family)
MQAGETMAIAWRWILVVCVVGLAAFVFSAFLVFPRPGEQHKEGNPMNNTRILVEYIRLESKKPFEEVTKTFEQQLGRFDPDVLKVATEIKETEEAKARIEALAGPSGLMLFGTQDHGALLRLAGQKRKAIQYVIGNPLIALQMTQHDIRASLYAPLRVLVYENDEGKTCVEYDKPWSLFGQFGNEHVNPTAVMLDRKFEALVAKTFE